MRCLPEPEGASQVAQGHDILSYNEIWRRAIWNFVLGTLIAVVPAVAFYSLALNYTPRQLGILLRLAVPGLLALLAVDLATLKWALIPVRRALACNASESAKQKGLERLLALPVLVLPRIFGPHAIIATLIFNLLVVWGNSHDALGIPPGDFALYWLLNLTVVPVGHVVFEFHATERLIERPLAGLMEMHGGALPPNRLVRLPIASRIFLFSVLLGLAPPVIGGFIAYQRSRVAGLVLPAGRFLQLTAVGAALAMLWLLLLALVSREVGDQTRAITATLERLAAGDLSAEAPVRSISEFGKIAAAVNAMAAGLRERQRLQQELAVARRIQQGLLPTSYQSFRHFQVAAVNQPCQAVGGDYFDLMELDANRLAFVIADVSGKGLGAALVTSLLQGAFSTLTLSAWRYPGTDRAGIFAHVNRFICIHSEVNRYATLFFGILDPSGRLEFLNAGHPPPLLIRPGQVETSFEGESFPVGMFEEAEFKISSAALNPGDTLLLFTDGVTDAENPAGERFGLERLQEVVAAHTHCTVNELQAAVLAAVEGFVRGAEQADDLTLLILHNPRGDGLPATL